LSVAGQEVAEPLGVLRGYLHGHGKTLRAYDLAGLGAPDILSREEVVRTRVIASRISHQEAAWFVERAAQAPWSAVPQHARLADADPMVAGGAYDDALALYDYFAAAAPVRVRGGKLHKVLHLKRPTCTRSWTANFAAPIAPRPRVQALNSRDTAGPAGVPTGRPSKKTSSSTPLRSFSSATSSSKTRNSKNSPGCQISGSWTSSPGP